MSSISSALCYQLSRRIVLRRQLGQTGANPASFDRGAYQAWRQRELEGQFADHFDPQMLRGKRVLDFGCGGGELSLMAAKAGAQSVTALEVSEDQHALAVANIAASDVMPRPQPILTTTLDEIPLPDASVDVILCFDVLEHILSYRSIIPEWHRVLQPGGTILVWWVPYYHPYGHHVESLVPLPWVHALLSDRSIIEACARVYDMPEFKPRVWDVDSAGQKKPNKWKQLATLPTLNKLTIRDFERLAAETGFEFQRRDYHPVGGRSSIGKISSVLGKVPRLREFFTACVVYDIVKPHSLAGARMQSRAA